MRSGHRIDETLPIMAGRPLTCLSPKRRVMTSLRCRLIMKVVIMVLRGARSNGPDLPGVSSSPDGLSHRVLPIFYKNGPLPSVCCAESG